MPEKETDNTVFVAGHTLQARISDLSGWLATDLLFFGRPDTLRSVLERFYQRIFSLSPDQSFLFAPEYLLTEAVCQEKKEIIPLNYLYGRDFEIRRPFAGFSRKNICRFHIHKDGIRFWLLSGSFHQIFRMKIQFFSFFTIDFCLGTTKK